MRWTAIVLLALAATLAASSRLLLAIHDPFWRGEN
jgi:hypothetical protein